jgi:peroxiredoxin
MALTFSPNPQAGDKCPEFKLPAVDGKLYERSSFFHGKPVVFMFICNHCPYVKAIEDRLIHLGHELHVLGVSMVGICSNDSSDYPEDSFPQLKKRAEEKKYPFVYLHDESQEVAKKFGAVCTPDFFVYDSAGELAYRGRLDDSWKDPAHVTHHDLSNAVHKLLAEQKVNLEQIPSMGCSIKWKADLR